MPHERVIVQIVKVVGKSGQISLGKALAGQEFLVEEFPDGDIVLKRAVVVPINERWLHEPAMQEKLARADAWMRENPARATDLDALESRPAKDAVNA
jgi:hypothetical protein